MRLILPLLMLLWITACTTLFPKDKLVLQPVSFQMLSGWDKDNHADALKVFRRSCPSLERTAQNILPALARHGATPKGWKYVCSQARQATDSSAKEFFETYFTPYTILNKRQSQGLFTGYYEAELKGSWHRKAGYTCPLYKRPPEQTGTAPYYSRADINRGALAGRNLELVWLDDPVETFFLHIQGSGVITLPDGKIMRVGYDGKNNHPYVALGKCMIDQGLLTKETLSAASIKTWLRTHPAQADKLMEQNPSYVFFRSVAGEGPIGAQGIALTPGRSLAIDHRFIPYGAPLWLDTSLTKTGESFQHLMVAQDTGGAIRSPVRGDIFFGRGNDAMDKAGTQNSRGSYTILLPTK